MRLPRDPALDPKLDPAVMTEIDWKGLLSPHEFQILRHAGTEAPGTGRYLDEERGGSYHCAGCAQRLYGGEHKFDSGCGWPSFFDAVAPGALRLLEDRSFGRIRTEMRCSRCDGHLGHIFDDAPHMPTGKRHCVNGTALIFVPDGADPEEVVAAHRESSADAG